jgi:phytoene dehydrogenase-like protein
VFRELDLDLDWTDPPVPMVHVTDEEGGEIALHRDLEATAASLERCTRGAGAAWQELVQTLWPHREALIKTVLSSRLPFASAARLLGGLRSRVVDLAPLAIGSSASAGGQLFGDERAAAWLAGSGAHSDLSPLAGGSMAFSLGLNFLGHHVGWPFPRGGAQRLPDALTTRLVGAGGELRCQTPAAKIELAADRVAAVRLANEERISVDAVIATPSPRPLMELLPPGVLPGRVERRLRQWRYGLGTAKLDCALSAPVPWRGNEARRAAVVHLGGPLREMVMSLTEAGLGRFPEHPALVVGQQSLHDPTRAPEGKHTLYAYARVPARPQLTSDQLADQIEQQIERFAPGFRALIEARSIRSPQDIERQNSSLADGDLASGSCEPDQQFIFRPHPALFRGGTPIRGLYVAGAWVHPGPGVHGVSGQSAAVALLRDRRLRRL